MRKIWHGRLEQDLMLLSRSRRINRDIVMFIVIVFFTKFSVLSSACKNRGESLWCLMKVNDWQCHPYFIYPPLNTLTFTGWFAFLLRSPLSAVVSLLGEWYQSGMELNLNQPVQILATSPSPPPSLPNLLSVILTIHTWPYIPQQHTVFLCNSLSVDCSSLIVI